jgi:putative transcriptional regulator
MTVTRHPPEELLLDYAAGTTDEAVSLALATHLTLCSVCRKDVALAESLGGAFLEDEADAPLSGDALSKVLTRLDESDEDMMPASSKPSNIPAPLRAYIGDDFASVRWTNAGGGTFFKRVFRRKKANVRLIRSATGEGVGFHTHRADEYTLCLSGGYSDETGRYARGDWQSATPDLLHRPVADAGEDCISLSVNYAPLRFRHWGIALIAKWFGF